ncbi:YibE/F family protein [Candidatus Dojkabacteria bacterium]|nr:YibE/F family protein [Candidatus Dojkabacteria bacterium]
MFKILKNNNVLAITILFLFVLGNTLFFLLVRKDDQNLEKAIVIDATEISEDGGLFFQNLRVLNESDEKVEVRANLKSEDSERIKSGDKIILTKLLKEDGSKSYQYESILRTDPLLWVFLLFILAIFITIGLEGIKYLFPFLFLLPFFLSSLFPYLLSSVDLYALTFILLLVITFLTTLIRLSDLNLSISITLSVMFTLGFVFFLNLVLQKVARIEDVYYSNFSGLLSEISFSQFRELLNVSVLFISFGALINTSMEVCSSVKMRLEKVKTMDLMKVIRKGVEHAQKTAGREINNLFFVLLGFSLMSIFAFSKNNNVFNLWNSAFVVQLILYFLSASFAVILIAPVSSLVTGILVYNNKSNGTRKRLYV